MVVDHNGELERRVRAARHDLRVVQSVEGVGVSGARNAGLKSASGDIVAFLDDDATADANWLKGLAGPYTDDRVVGVGGAGMPMWESKRPTWLPVEFYWVIGCSWRGLPVVPSATRNLTGPSMSFRRGPCLDAGGFAAELWPAAWSPRARIFCEETELSIRLVEKFPESKLVYLPDVVVHHYVPKDRTSVRYFVKRCWREGRVKRIVSQLVGSSTGLSRERAQLARIIPSAILLAIRDALRGELSALKRIPALLGGTLVTVVAFWLPRGAGDRRAGSPRGAILSDAHCRSRWLVSHRRSPGTAIGEKRAAVDALIEPPAAARPRSTLADKTSVGASLEIQPDTDAQTVSVFILIDCMLNGRHGWTARRLKSPRRRRPAAFVRTQPGSSESRWRFRSTRRPAGAAAALLALIASPSALVVHITDHHTARTVRASVAPRPKPVAPPVVPPGMHLVFNDEFTGVALNPFKWDTCYPWANSGAGCTNFGNPELEWYLPSQDGVSGGAVHLSMSKTPTSGITRSGQPKTYQWRSGIITTNHSLEFTYGYVAVRARMPKGSGLWSALYLLPQTQLWPPEIDIAEVYGVDTNHFSVTLHPTLGVQFPRTISTPDLSAGWHTYAIDWEPSSITWYIDGRRVDHYQGDRSPSQPMYFVADLAVADLFGVEPTGETPKRTSLDIRSVSIYQR